MAPELPQQLALACATVQEQALFDALTGCLARQLAIDHVALSHLAPRKDGLLVAYGLAQWQQGQACAPENYLLEKGPGQWTLEWEHCRLDGPLYREFPRDRRLGQHSHASYQGWLLRDDQQTPIGILCLLHHAPLPPAGLLDGWLAPYLPRLSAELQRLRQQQARAAQGRRQQLLLEHSLTLLALLDGEGHLLSISPALCQALGSPESGLLGRPLWSLPPLAQDPQLAGEIKHSVKLAQRQGQRLRRLLTLPSQDETPRQLDLLIHPLPATPEGASRVLLEARDISHWLRNSQQQRQEHHQLARALEQTGALAWRWEVQADLWHWLTPAQEAFAAVQDSAGLLAHFPPAEAQRLRQRLELSWQQGEAWQFEGPWHLPAGGSLWVRLQGAAEGSQLPAASLWGLLENRDPAHRLQQQQHRREARLSQELTLLGRCLQLSQQPLGDRLRQLCQDCCQLLELDRVGIWRYQTDTLENLLTYHGPSAREFKEPALPRGQFAALFDYLPAHPFLDAHHARADLRSREADTSFLAPRHIQSLLAQRIGPAHAAKGVLLLTQEQRAREWQDDEIELAQRLAALLDQWL
ncbi:GAF domain-containing protein [Pseudaeromonas paramecii]|uniref:PAS domain-containing protein n=1 Tax=Pseudaeromonas paramecii TaxID=2138166 RepID=A0ABP8PWG3_9GAMM